MKKKYPKWCSKSFFILFLGVFSLALHASVEEGGLSDSWEDGCTETGVYADSYRDYSSHLEMDQTKKLMNLKGKLELIYHEAKGRFRINSWDSETQVEEKALILYPQDDYNGAFDLHPKSSPNTLQMLREISEKYDVKMIRIHLVQEFKELILNSFGSAKIGLLIVGGHGCGSHITFSRDESLTLSTDIRSLQNCFSHDAIIYLDSCSTGSFDNVFAAFNIADYFAIFFPESSVFAPKIKHVDSYVRGIQENGVLILKKGEENICYNVTFKILKEAYEKKLINYFTSRAKWDQYQQDLKACEITYAKEQKSYRSYRKYKKRWPLTRLCIKITGNKPAKAQYPVRKIPQHRVTEPVMPVEPTVVYFLQMQQSSCDTDSSDDYWSDSY